MSVAFNISGCGTWSEMTTMFYLSTRPWGLREERWSTVFHTVLEKVTAKHLSDSVNSRKCCFFFKGLSICWFQDDFFSNLDCQNQTIGVQTCFKPQKASLLLYDIPSFSEILAAGTSHGRIALWRMVVQPGSNRGDTKAQWKLQTPTEIQGNVVQLQVLTGPAVGHNICLDKSYSTNLTTSICMWSSLWPSI